MVALEDNDGVEAEETVERVEANVGVGVDAFERNCSDDSVWW